MHKDQLLEIVKFLDADVPLHKEMEAILGIGSEFGSAWYSSQKEHWVKWLAEYETPGFYGRQTKTKRDARYIYNHIMCPPMLFWLAEAACVPKLELKAAFRAVIAAKPNPAKRCAALRQHVRWELVELSLKP